jgi:hypothetical protein
MRKSNICTRPTKLSSSMCTRVCKSRRWSQNSRMRKSNIRTRTTKLSSSMRTPGVQNPRVELKQCQGIRSPTILSCFSHPGPTTIGIFRIMSRHSAENRLRLVSVVVLLYLTLAYVTSDFFLHAVHYGSSSRLQLPGYNSSASSFSLSVSITILNLIISEFNSWTTNLRK